MKKRDYTSAIKSLASPPDKETEFYVELSQTMGTNRFDYRILRFVKDPDSLHCGVTIAEVVCEGCSFLSRESAIASADEWIEKQLLNNNTDA